MSTTSTAYPPAPDPANLQGLIYRGYTHKYSVHQMFNFPAGSNPALFVKTLLPLVRNAAHWGDVKPVHFLNIGFTYSGLVAMNLPGVTADYFPIEFRQGPTSYFSQQSLYDLGTSDPSTWTFGGPANAVDAVVHAYAMDEASLVLIEQAIAEAAKASGVVEHIPMKTAPYRYYSNQALGDFIQFGYRDGIDQPSLSWPTEMPATGSYTATDTANNFIVGYPGSAVMPGPTDTPDGTGAFAKDGFYDAFRVFYQDVGAFENFLTRNAPLVMSRLNVTMDFAREWLAAKLVGRWRDGSPLELTPDAPNPELATATDFDYTNDTKGLRCPFAAHTRVANPRTQPLFTQTEMPFPRIVRRGLPYGAVPQPPSFEGEQGLIGIFLCGSISQQFEKICGWMNLNNMSPVFSFLSQDAVLANREVPQVSTRYEIPMMSGDPLVLDLTGFQFVVTRGTAYCFLPSLAGLQSIANTAS